MDASCLNKNTVSLNWSPPKDDGGCPISNYVIDQAIVKSKMATATTVSYWEPVTRNLPLEDLNIINDQYCFNVTHLTSDKFMLFRIGAQNKQGIGDYGSLSTPILVQSPHHVPGSPTNLRGHMDMKTGKVELEWDKPEQDGGASILNYLIERNATQMDSNWSEIKLDEVSPKTQRSLPRIKDGTYWFRVCAVNDAGCGSYSDLISLVIQKTSDKPDAPGQPTVQVIKDGVALIRWTEPLNEGNAGPVEGYDIERCEVGLTKWTTMNVELCKSTQFEVDQLDLSRDYIFQIKARNKAGWGPPSDPSIPVKPVTDAEFVRPLKNQLVNELPSDVCFECEVSSPGLTVIWSKDGRDLNLSTRSIYLVLGEGSQAFCIHRLTLIKVGPEDQGLYSARLASGKRTEAKLTIECPPKIDYSGSTNIQLIGNKSLVIEVPYSGAPTPKINWSFNQGILPVGPKRDQPLVSVDTVYGLTCLRLRHATTELTGTYKVMVIVLFIFL